jgi:broad specificity phosphatase PhoE
MLHLVRHAVYDDIGRILSGRTAGIRLAEEGHEQARRIAARFSCDRIAVVQSSPRERARETAAPIAEQASLKAEIAPALDEIDLGEWTGRSFAALNDDPDWQSWNAFRGTARPPGGEGMLELQQRIVAHLDKLSVLHPDQRLVLVSHAEVIRAAILHALRIPLDDFARIEIAPASISTIAIGRHSREVVALNETVAP